MTQLKLVEADTGSLVTSLHFQNEKPQDSSIERHSEDLEHFISQCPIDVQKYIQRLEAAIAVNLESFDIKVPASAVSVYRKAANASIIESVKAVRQRSVRHHFKQSR